ncbi:unnamed protein product [Urochloa humidicola]
MGHSALKQKLEGLPALVQLVISNDDPSMQLVATTQFRKLLSIGEIWILYITACGAYTCARQEFRGMGHGLENGFVDFMEFLFCFSNNSLYAFFRWMNNWYLSTFFFFGV